MPLTMNSHSAVLAQVLEAKVLVFDFDGTLVDSNPIKRRAFERCFETFADKRQEILEFCCGNPHIPRGEKFRFVFERILHRPYTAQMEAQLHQQFEAQTTQQIVEAPTIPGAERFLKTTQNTHRLFLLSSTPHAILLEILRQRGWQSHFDQIRGAPVKKAGWLKTLCRREGLTPRQVLFFGDTEEDANAATQAGCSFVSVRNGWCGGGDLFSIDDFEELLR